MPLAELEAALGRAILAGGGPAPGDLDEAERDAVTRVVASPGFAFTVRVQRSWCRGRTARGAQLTLALLPHDLRRRLLDGWVEAGGGTSSFFTADAVGFLAFAATRLPQDSVGRAMAELEAALLRASELGQPAPDPQAALHRPDALLASSPAATLIVSRFPPTELLAALDGGTKPRARRRALPLLFAPGVPGLHRRATPAERRLLRALASPRPAREVLTDDPSRKAAVALLRDGALRVSAPITVQSTS